MAKDIILQGKSIVKANPGITLQEQDDNWGILYEPDSDTSFAVNPISIFIWKQLNVRLSIEEIVTKVIDNCSNVSEDVEEHVKVLLKSMLEKNFITLENSN